MHATPLSQIPLKPLHWLWQSRIPRGKLSLLAGDPASGKTSLALYLAAPAPPAVAPLPEAPQSPPFATARATVPQHSNGTPTPSPTSPTLPLITNITNTTNPLAPLATLLLSPEDNASDTLRPRLESLNANLDHIHIAQDIHSLIPPRSGLSTQDSGLSPSPLDQLEQLIISIPNLALIIIDPITHYLGLTDRLLPNTDPSLPRTILAHLSHLAEKHNLAILLTTRLSKRVDPTSQISLQKILGSLAFASTARSVNLLLPYPAQAPSEIPTEPPTPSPTSPLITNTTNTTNITNTLTPTTLLLTIKSNPSHLPPHLQLRIDHTVTFLETPFNPNDLKPKQKPKPFKTPGPTALVTQSIAQWLTTFLQDGPVPATRIINAAKTNAISTTTLHRAKAHANIDSVKLPGSISRWFWTLPNDPRPLPEETLGDEVSDNLANMFLHPGVLKAFLQQDPEDDPDLDFLEEEPEEPEPTPQPQPQPQQRPSLVKAALAKNPDDLTEEEQLAVLTEIKRAYPHLFVDPDNLPRKHPLSTPSPTEKSPQPKKRSPQTPAPTT